MPKLQYSFQAKDDLKPIARFIAKDKPNAARQWVSQLREKCRNASQHPELGDDRSELGKGIRSTYLSSYAIFFRRTNGFADILRIIRGDVDKPRI